jgi:hypothetical protein
LLGFALQTDPGFRIDGGKFIKVRAQLADFDVQVIDGINAQEAVVLFCILGCADDAFDEVSIAEAVALDMAL